MEPDQLNKELKFHIQELKNELTRIKISEERTRLAVEAVDDGIFDFDLKRNETFFSPRYYTMLGYEPYEMPASRETWINLLHPEDRKWAVTHVDEQIRKKEKWTLEFRLRTKDGGYKWILGGERYRPGIRKEIPSVEPVPTKISPIEKRRNWNGKNSSRN